MENDRTGEVSGIDGYLFRLIATFEAAAMQQMGKIAHPLTGDVEVDLPGASDSIEMLAAIQRKTEGNLNPDEKRLLDHVLYQLRMNYVDAAKEQGESGGAEGEGSGNDSGDATGDAPPEEEPAKTESAEGETEEAGTPDEEERS